MHQFRSYVSFAATPDGGGRRAGEPERSGAMPQPRRGTNKRDKESAQFSSPFERSNDVFISSVQFIIAHAFRFGWKVNRISRRRRRARGANRAESKSERNRVHIEIRPADVREPK